MKIDELRNLIARRDQHNQRLYRDLTRLSLRLTEMQRALFGGRLEQLRYLLRSLRRLFSKRST